MRVSIICPAERQLFSTRFTVAGESWTILSHDVAVCRRFDRLQRSVEGVVGTTRSATPSLQHACCFLQCVDGQIAAITVGRAQDETIGIVCHDGGKEPFKVRAAHQSGRALADRPTVKIPADRQTSCMIPGNS